MSNTGITNDSVGGHVANSASTFGESSSPQDRANTDYGSGGTSAGLGDNVEKDYGEPKKEGGVKGVVNKITDKMNPSHVEPAQKVSFCSLENPWLLGNLKGIALIQVSILGFWCQRCAPG